MTKLSPSHLRATLLPAIVMGVLMAQVAQAQIVMSSWTAGTNFDWSVNGNWTTAAFPDSPTAVAVFDDTSNVTTSGSLAAITIDMAGGTVESPATLDVAGVLLGASNTITRRIQTSVNSYGSISVHGFEHTVGGQTVNLLLGNFSAGDPADYTTMNFRPVSTSRVFEVRMENSGVIHVENPDARIWFLVPVTEGASPVTITKTGAGILHFGANYPSYGMNTTTGGLIIEEGFVRTNRNSIVVDGVMTESPFGLGPVTLRGGALQSSTTFSRIFDNDFVLDGAVTIGSTANAEYNAAITIRGEAGTATTMVADSALTVHNATTWEQPIAGEHRLTKDGEGTLVLAGNNSFAALSVLGGVVSVGSSASGNMPANPPTAGGTMYDHILLDGGVLQFTGSWATTPMGARRGIALGEAGGTIEVTGGFIVQTSAPMTDAGGGPGTFIKTGTGTFVLASSSEGATYTGETRVEAGRFFMNSILPNSEVDVAAGATLAGLGTFGGEISVGAGGVLAPGGRTTTGIMTADGAILMEAAAILAYRLDGTIPGDEHDQLVFKDTLSLDGVELQVALGYQPAINDVLVLADNQNAGSIVGTLLFGGQPLTEGSELLVETGDFSQLFTITYGYQGGGYTDSLALVAVPEPAAAAALAALLTLATVVLRRRRNHR